MLKTSRIMFWWYFFGPKILPLSGLPFSVSTHLTFPKKGRHCFTYQVGPPLDGCGVSKLVWETGSSIHEYDLLAKYERLTPSRRYWTRTWSLGSGWGRYPPRFCLSFVLTRLHPQGKGGHFGTLVWKTFKSLRSETSDQHQMDMI